MTSICESGDLQIGRGTSKKKWEPTKIVSEFGNFLHKSPNYLGKESTNNGPMGYAKKPDLKAQY